MASYQPQILDAPPQYGFLPGLASGIASGGEKFSNLYAESAIKDMFAKRDAKKKQEAINAFQAAMKNDPNMEMDQISMDESGTPKFTYKRKKTPKSIFEEDPIKAIKNVLLGVGMEQTGQALGYKPQQPASAESRNAYAQAMGSPGIDMSPYGMPSLSMPPSPMPLSLMEKRNAQGGAFQEFPEVVKSNVLSDFFPGMTHDQAMRDVMGVPTETPVEKFERVQKEKAAGVETIDEDTQSVISTIKTDKQLKLFLKNQENLRAQGVDVDAVKKHFGVE